MNSELISQATRTAVSFDWRKRLRFHAHHLLWHLGIPGVIGIGLAAFSIMIWLSAIMPLFAQRASIEATLDSRSQHLPSSDTQARQEALSAYLAAMPKSSQIASQLGQLHSHAEASNIRLTDTEYQEEENGAESLGPLSSFIVTLKAAASPDATISFINHVLTAMPNSALDALTVERAGSDEVSTKILLRFRLYMRPA